MACELSTGDELLLTELVFNNFFTDLDSAQTAALLSVLVFNPPQQKGGKAPPRLRDELDSHLNEMKETARRVGTVLKEAKVDIDVQEYIDKIQPGIAEVVYQWAQGKPFREVCDVTKEFEGCVRVCVCVCVSCPFLLFPIEYPQLSPCDCVDLFSSLSLTPIRTIIRCIRRLKEMLAQLSAAAKGIGSEELDKHFERTSEKIARDIVFAPSLYL